MGAAGRARTCEAVQRRRLSALATLLGCATRTRPRAHIVKTLRALAWRAVCGVARLVKGTTIHFVARLAAHPAKPARDPDT